MDQNTHRIVNAKPHGAETAQLLKATRAALEDERLPWEEARQWRETVAGYELLCGQVPDKLIYRLLVRHEARHFWNCQAARRRRWFSVEKHRGFTGRMLAQFALANGWTEEQTALLLEAWRHHHDLPLHDVEC
jgi:hypothetical protein